MMHFTRHAVAGALMGVCILSLLTALIDLAAGALGEAAIAGLAAFGAASLGMLIVDWE